MGRKTVKKKVICPECGDEIDSRGLHGHLRFAHDMTTDAAREASKGVVPFVADEPEDQLEGEARVVALLEEISAKLHLNGEGPMSDDGQDDDGHQNDDTERTLSYIVMESLRHLRGLDEDRALIRWGRPVTNNDDGGTEGGGVLTDSMADMLDAELRDEAEALRSQLDDLLVAHGGDLEQADPSEITVESSWDAFFGY